MRRRRIFITGSTDGLGRAAARRLIDQGHQVALHARTRERAAAVDDLASRSAGVVVGDLRSTDAFRMLLEMLPLIALYELGIQLARLFAPPMPARSLAAGS